MADLNCESCLLIYIYKRVVTGSKDGVAPFETPLCVFDGCLCLSGLFVNTQ